jgi:uncharacterized membrane protein
VDMALIMLGFMPFIRWMNLLLWPVVGLGFFMLWLIAMINAFTGKRFKLPVIGDLAEKQANG